MSRKKVRKIQRVNVKNKSQGGTYWDPIVVKRVRAVEMQSAPKKSCNGNGKRKKKKKKSRSRS